MKSLPKLLCLVVMVALAATLVACGGANAASSAKKHEVANDTFPLYNGTEKSGTELKLYFLDGAKDLPYIDASDCLALLKETYHGTVDFTMSTEGSVVTYSRANKLYDTDVPLTIDFDKDVMHYADYNLFSMRADQSTMLDLTSIDVVNEAGDFKLLQKVGTGTLDRRGDVFEVNLGDYGIDLVNQDGLYLIPLQTVADILIAPTWLESLYFNGQCVIKADDISKCGDLYYSAPTGNRSDALAEFGYNELCMMLDTLYGLKEDHKIESFDQLFKETGFTEALKGPDSAEADKAVYRLITEYLDDVHSHWYGFSYLTGPIDYTALGTSRARVLAARERQEASRDKYYPDSIPGYEEVGNTAYVTFDAFTPPPSADYYYGVDDVAKLPDDTISQIIKAHAQITREGSPIENVVLDMSDNGGGDATAAEFTISWFLGEGSIGMEDAMTGAQCVSSYRADVNLDGEFDEKDTLAGKKLFCLTSPVSFSSGNLVPCMLKESNVVTLLGRPSAGGACVIQPISSAWGTSFRISSPRRLSFMKNGSFYDIDRGADPDYVLTDPDSFYDRAALTEYINGLY